MKITVLDEPSLEFGGGGRHVDPRHGITDFGPADASNTAVRTIRAGIIGAPSAIDGLKRWFDRCRLPLAGKDSHLGNLFLPFPGFDTTVGYRCTLVWDSRLERPIRDRDLKRLADLDPLTAVREAVALYAAALEGLDEEPNCDVILVARPDDLPERDEATPTPGVKPDRAAPPLAADFRALLKAASLRGSRPIQVVRRTTWDPGFQPRRERRRGTQDVATTAWNLHTALYYKAGGVPWRLPRDAADLTSCYVGVSFYRSGDGTTLQTSVAQVFNQRGDGVIVRGSPAKVSKDDRQPHLNGQDAEALLSDALRKYRAEHRTLPARVVMHKTSNYTREEIDGFRAAADDSGLDVLELLWLPGTDKVRLFRQASNPPLRGTLLSLDETRHALYAKGSVPFYRTYPGMYVPTPLAFRLVEAESSPEAIGAEILALTKMNWNQTQMDGRMPITLHTADRVGEVLRHLGPHDRPQGRYAFYM
jgi:hypothetical protein